MDVAMDVAMNSLPFRSVMGVLDGLAAERFLAGELLPPGLGGVELRADLQPDITLAFDLLRKLPRDLPCLFTLRIEAQGGEYRGSEDERVDIFRGALDAGATMIDVEWGSSAADTLTAQRLPVVLSQHNFDGMLSSADLEETTKAMSHLGPRAIKIVPRASCLGDAVRMLDWVAAATADAPARIGFAMGEPGLVSRILSPARGAPYTYGSLGESVAPGQPSVSELIDLYRVGELGPDTRVFGVAGNPVSHSLSPHMHNPALAAEGLDAVYLPFFLGELDELNSAWDALNIDGLSVTIPFKQDAFRLADEADERARAAAAANTLVVRRQGGARRLLAYNTDFEGVLEPLRRRLPDLAGLSVAVLGNGGAARGAVQALKECSARPSIVFRNIDRGLPVAREMGVPGLSFDDFRSEDFSAIINATSLGLRPGDPSPLPAEAFDERKVAFDMVYDPPETEFLRLARSRGAATIEGGEMLVSQGLVQFELFTGRTAPRDLFSESFASALESRSTD